MTVVFDLLKKLLSRQGSDLFMTVGFPPAIKRHGELTPLGKKALTSEQTRLLARSLMTDDQIRTFETTKECNFAIHPHEIGRFRVNAFVQQGQVGLVIRVITTEIPNCDQLKLPTILKKVVMSQRGLVLVVGGTGSGKSTTLAAMLGHRNAEDRGHIITIEDPVEYVHPHRQSIITQREVGVDTASWEIALKNTLRQAPDVILIGEIRDRETMEYALQFSETGHLCLSTLHANNADQALDRIVNLFPEEKRSQLLMDLSLNLHAIISQRLLPRQKKSGQEESGRVAAMEILLPSPLIADKILKGKFHELKEIMAKSMELGMKTFDQALFDLYESGEISYETALHNADAVNDLRLRFKLESKRRASATRDQTGLEGMTLVEKGAER